MKSFLSVLVAIAILTGCQQKEYKVGDTINLLNATQQDKLDKIFEAGHVIKCNRLDTSLKKVVGSVEISKKDYPFIHGEPFSGTVFLEKSSSGSVMIPLSSTCKIIK